MNPHWTILTFVSLQLNKERFFYFAMIDNTDIRKLY